MKTTTLDTVVLKHGTVFDPVSGKSEVADVLIEKGRITSLGKVEAGDRAKVLDCSGKIITMGFCDPHVHFREPGREDKETLASGAAAALAGGFTRVCVMPNTNPPLDTPESVRFVIEKSRNLPVHIHPIGAVTKQQGGQEITEMAAMRDEGAVAFSDDGLPIADSHVMRLALEYSTLLDVPVINHAEDPALRACGLMNEGTVSTRLGLPGNPALAEAIMVYRDLELARLTGAILHVPHVSSDRSVAHIAALKGQGTRITAEVTPHHLYYTDQALTAYNTNLKVAPPIRSAADRETLWEGLTQGTLDCIATDHAPHTIEEKEHTFDMAPFGLIGLETAFGAVNTTRLERGAFSLEDLIRKMTVAPRAIFGFPTDLIREGAEAELVVLDPDTTWVMSESDLESRSRNCPYLGESFIGRPVFTISRGYLADMRRD